MNGNDKLRSLFAWQLPDLYRAFGGRRSRKIRGGERKRKAEDGVRLRKA